ncbi:hypothetical protein V500_10092, partial [Pseudogymnoascus sp. VKM F-4518 (FW-2643)]
MCTAFEWLIQDAQYKAVREVVGQQALFEANKKEVEKETNMPLLLFVFRAEDDEPEFRPPYVLTDAQQSSMQTVRDKIGSFQEWKQEQEKNAAGEDRDEDEGFDDGEDDEGIDKDVEGTDEEVDEGFEDEMSEETKRMRQIQRESAIISGLAVLMMKSDKGWHDAEDFTTKYSAVIKLARLMVVQEA